MESETWKYKQIIWEGATRILQGKIKSWEGSDDKGRSDLNVAETDYKQVFSKVGQ